MISEQMWRTEAARLCRESGKDVLIQFADRIDDPQYCWGDLVASMISLQPSLEDFRAFWRACLQIGETTLMLAALAVFRDDLEFNKMMWAETSPSTPLLIREILVCHPVLEDFFSTEENRPEERVLLGLLESPAIKAAKNQTFERLLRSIVRQCIIGIDSRPPLIENPDVVVIEPTPEKLAEIAAAKAAHKV